MQEGEGERRFMDVSGVCSGAGPERVFLICYSHDIYNNQSYETLSLIIIHVF